LREMVDWGQNNVESSKWGYVHVRMSRAADLRRSQARAVTRMRDTDSPCVILNDVKYARDTIAEEEASQSDNRFILQDLPRSLSNRKRKIPEDPTFQPPPRRRRAEKPKTVPIFHKGENGDVDDRIDLEPGNGNDHDDLEV